MSKRVKILVADDEPNILALVCGILQEENFDVISATNGVEATEKAFREKPDLMVVDIRMPLKNGFQVVEEVRNHPDTERTLIIILSALEDELNKLTGFEKGADDYLTKPFSTEELKARIQALLKRSRGFIPGNRAVATEKVEEKEEKIPTGIALLDASLEGGFAKGSNILITGMIGMGKSTLARTFFATGLKRNEKCLFISLDENPSRLRSSLNYELENDIVEYEKLNYARFIDAYSWAGGGEVHPDEKYAISGVLNLSNLTDLIQNAREDLGQTKEAKQGGRMVMDSLSSLMINFEPTTLQTFLTQLTRSATALGKVTSFFILEEGIVEESIVKQVNLHMDGALELGEINGKNAFRITRLKWQAFPRDWMELDARI